MNRLLRDIQVALLSNEIHNASSDGMRRVLRYQIIPLNPYQFNGRPLSEIAARLGIADRQFSEQGMMIQHYYMAMCHLLLFVDETGTGPVILHIDVRAPNLGANLEEEACFTQIGARADAFQDRGR